MKNILKALSLSLIILSISIFLPGCKNNSNEDEVILGTISGPETTLAETARKVAKEKYNLKVVIKEFNDYNSPNRALDEGVIDANMFQHEPYLNEARTDHGYDFKVLAKTFVYPMGLYSNKHKTIDMVPVNAVIAIPNDPSNQARALLLLAKAKLITLDPKISPSKVTIKNIVSNPFNLKIKELDAAGIPRILPDVGLAAINTNYAILASLTPSKDALFLEDSDSLYANLVVIKSKDLNTSKMQNLKSAFQSPEIKDKAKQVFSNQAIPAF